MDLLPSKNKHKYFKGNLHGHSNHSDGALNPKDVVKKLRGPKGSKVIVTIARIGMEETFETTLVRDKIPIRSVASSFMLEDEVGYIKVTRFAGTTYNEFTESITKLNNNGMKKLLIDFLLEMGLRQRWCIPAAVECQSWSMEIFKRSLKMRIWYQQSSCPGSKRVMT